MCYSGVILPCLKSDYTELLKPYLCAFYKKPHLFLYNAMKHPHLWKYFYFEMVKNHSSIHGWNSIMAEAYKFSEYYNTTPRSDKACLPLRSMEKMTTMTEATHLMDTLQKPYISGCFDREGKEECIAIRKCVEDFVLQITKQVEIANKNFAATPILSGSVAEGAKVSLPDEFDFILHLHGLQDAFDKHEETLEYIFSFGQSFDTSKIFSQYIDAFTKAVKEYPYQDNIYILKSPFHTPEVKPFTITLLWEGNFFKHLHVNIDLVPGFKVSYQKAKTRVKQLEKESAKSQIFAVFKKHQLQEASLRLSYSLHERDLLQALPLYVKNGYRLAKAVRHSEVCQNMQLPDKTFAPVDEYVTTYMLKTCLLHTVKEFEQNQFDDNEWLSPLSIKWAIKIYEQMKLFLEIFEGKIPNYFLHTQNICSGQPLDHSSGENAQYYNLKHKITLTFIDCILQLLKELFQQRLQVRCLIQ